MRSGVPRRRLARLGSCTPLTSGTEAHHGGDCGEKGRWHPGCVTEWRPSGGEERAENNVTGNQVSVRAEENNSVSRWAFKFIFCAFQLGKKTNTCHCLCETHGIISLFLVMTVCDIKLIVHPTLDTNPIPYLPPLHQEHCVFLRTNWQGHATLRSMSGFIALVYIPTANSINTQECA